MDPAADKLDVLRSMCVGCGACRDACPSYRHGGCDPLEVMNGNLRKVFDCVGCGSCERVCGHTHPKEAMLAAYSIVLDMNVSQAFLDTGLAKYPEEDAPGMDLEPVWTGDDVYVMPGCTAKCVVPYVVYATSSAMMHMGERASELPDFTCCMYPVQFGRMDDTERKSYRMKMSDTAGGRELVMLCPGCSEIMRRDSISCEHIIEFLHGRMDALPSYGKGIKVSIEPGCAALEHFGKMVDVVEAMGFEWIGNEPGCCGKNSRNVAAPLMSERQSAASDADIIVAGCPMCVSKYDSVPGGKPVAYISELVAAGFGDTGSLRCHIIPVPLPDRNQL